jgi:hypothetical protein
MLIGAGVGVRVAEDGLQHPLGILELHLLILLRIHLLFVIPLAGRCALLAQLLLLLAELFHELLDFPSLFDTVTRGVMHRALHAIVIATRHLTGALAISRSMVPTSRH